MDVQNAIEILGETKLLTPLGQACFVAIEALKKQVPKKPIFKEDYDAYDSYYICPSCGAMVTGLDNYCSGNRECEEKGCGQRLDWSVEE